jgi:hypothetical protein
VEEVDHARLNQLVDELASDPGYATGARKFGRRVSNTDADAIAGALQHEIDRGVEARGEQIAQQGLQLACKRGCNGCCEEPIMVFRPESMRVVRWLERPENAEVRAAFRAQYPAWRDKVGSTPDKLSAKYVQEPLAYTEAHVAAWRMGVMCAFNRDGACMIYPVRPSNCRTAHALDTAEFCNGASTRPAARVTFVPLEKFVTRSRQLLAAAHNAARGPKGRVEALCKIVYETLPP